MDKVKNLWSYRKEIKKTFLCAFSQTASKCLAEICRTQYGNAMLLHLSDAPIWLYRRLIICTKQTSIINYTLLYLIRIKTWPFNDDVKTGGFSRNVTRGSDMTRKTGTKKNFPGLEQTAQIESVLIRGLQGNDWSVFIFRTIPVYVHTY